MYGAYDCNRTLRFATAMGPYMFLAGITWWAVLAVALFAIACTTDPPRPTSTTAPTLAPTPFQHQATELTNRACTIIQSEGENFLARIITSEEYFDQIIPALILIEEDMASGANLDNFGDNPLVSMFSLYLGNGVGPRHAELLQEACSDNM